MYTALKHYYFVQLVTHFALLSIICSASYFDNDGVKLVLDEPFNGAIYSRSIYDPANGGAVTLAGALHIHFHIDCSRPNLNIPVLNLNAQLNEEWLFLGNLHPLCNNHYNILVSDKIRWFSYQSNETSSGNGSTTFGPFGSGFLLGLNSFGIFASDEEGVVLQDMVTFHVASCAEHRFAPCQEHRHAANSSIRRIRREVGAIRGTEPEHGGATGRGGSGVSETSDATGEGVHTR
eukprot:CAMPEP_0113675038 /NCGR_PEP_ID=MMETSP0038_2-20120614/7777_1 /TAXON_ID=2898 /ORGANISM="Cryptomonas paramecium" /LENGTH=233 /DNA_ID=CAMNT_0000591735 /DNA_START=672 /DNA_END=1369 /DNA_ORIENTATION=+ /assembly_acc=CAM_ASM_000170